MRSSWLSPFNLLPHSAASASSYDLSIYTSAFASVLGVIDLRVEIHTSEINEYLFFLWWSVTTKKSKSILTKCWKCCSAKFTVIIMHELTTIFGHVVQHVRNTLTGMACFFKQSPVSGTIALKHWEKQEKADLHACLFSSTGLLVEKSFRWQAFRHIEPPNAHVQYQVAGSQTSYKHVICNALARIVREIKRRPYFISECNAHGFLAS